MLKSVNQNTILYEYPATEAIRVLIRLEYVLDNFYLHINNLDKNGIFIALKNIDDALKIIKSDDVIKYLIKESDALLDDMIIWRDNPDVDLDLFNEITTDLRSIAANLVNAKDTAVVSESHFFKDFHKRCESSDNNWMPVDFPRFNFWMNQNGQSVASALNEWCEAFDPIYESTQLILRLIREGAIQLNCIANEGYFQETLDKETAYKIISVRLPADAPYYPEITGSRMHISIRMLTDDWAFGSTRYKENVPFVLLKCS